MKLLKNEMEIKGRIYFDLDEGRERREKMEGEF